MSNITQILLEIERDFCENNHKGYDPYDVLGSRIFYSIFKRKFPFRRKLMGILSFLEFTFPLLSRKLLLIRPMHNNKALGLIASTYLDRYERTGDEIFLTRAEELLDTLLVARSPGWRGYCWGYPFNWYSRVIIKRNVPSTVVTTIVALAFFKYEEVTNTKRYNWVLLEIEKFYAFDLVKMRTPSGTCYSYTPIDEFKVYNANLFTGLFFAHFYKLTGSIDSKHRCEEILTFTANGQNSNGSWNYWYGESDSIIDHFHTGYVLRHSKKICDLTGTKDFQYMLDKGVNYFLKNLYSDKNIPKFSVELDYPVDIHALAESILVFVDFKDVDSVKNQLSSLSSTVQVLLNEFYQGNGKFSFQIDGRRHAQTMNYIRWNQSWAYFALNEFEKNYEYRDGVVNRVSTGY